MTATPSNYAYDRYVAARDRLRTAQLADPQHPAIPRLSSELQVAYDLYVAACD